MNIGYQTGADAATNWVPFNGTNETAGNDLEMIRNYSPENALERCTFIAPYSGTIKRMCWRCENLLVGKTGSALRIGLYEAAGASEVPNVFGIVGTIFVQNSLTSAPNKTVAHDPTDWNLSAGGLYAVRVDTGGASQDTVMSLVVEYDPDLGGGLGDIAG